MNQSANTSNKTAARSRCPLSFVANQTGFRVATLQTPSMIRVEIAILQSLFANEYSDERASFERLG
jgi:hypothetical protein